MKELPRYYFFLFICLTVICCNQETREQQIGQEYLDSEDYNRFQEKSRQEIIQKENQLQGISEHLKQVPQCSTVELPFPFVINQNAFGDLQEHYPDCNLNTNNEDSGFVLKILGANSLQDIDLYWVLVEWRSLYTDQELVAVTVQNDTLLSFKTVGVFQKNLTKDILTETRGKLQNGRVRILSVTNRKIIYPIEQNNTEITEYVIDTQGTIREL